MIMFYSGIVVLLLSAGLFLWWPFMNRYLFRSDAVAESDVRTSTNVVLYRDHLKDLEQSLAASVIEQSEFDQLKIELERNLLEDSQEFTADTANVGSFRSARSVRRWLMVPIAALLLVVAGGAYHQLGAYDSWQLQIVLERRAELERQYAVSRDQGVKSQVLAANYDVLEHLSSYLIKRPDNLQVRALLARTLMSLGLYEKAIVEFRAILLREPTLNQVMAELAQALFISSGNHIGKEVQALIANVLQAEPRNTLALGLAGIAAFQVERYQQAIEFWVSAMTLQGVDSANSIALMEGVQVARQRLGQKITTEADLQEAKADGAVNDHDSSGYSIAVRVSLAADVVFSPEDTVFIYAREWKGAKIPLAITRVQASQLPTMVTLTDSMSMAPEMNLSSVEQLELVARLSPSGQAVAQAGDWQASIGPIAAEGDASSSHTLVIAQKLP